MEDNKKINILHLRCTFNIGGIEKVMQNLIEANNFNSDIKVKHVLVILKKEVNEQFIKELRSLDYKIIILGDKKNNILKVFLKLIKILKSEKINLIHTNDIGSMKMASLCKFIMPKLKLIYTAHSCNIISNTNFIEKLLLKNLINTNIAVSDSVYSEFINKSINNSMIIYNGINISKFKSVKNKLQNNSSLKLVNVGWLRLPIKGQDVLLKALAECKNRGMNITCDFIGDFFDKESESYVKKIIREENIANEVNFLGVQNNISELLTNYDIFILPSRSEGLSLALLEAMASKLSIIASKIEGTTKLIKDNETGLLFNNDDYKDLADKIQYLYNNKEVMQNLAENAYKFVQDFDISIMQKKYFKIYCDLLGVVNE